MTHTKGPWEAMPHYREHERFEIYAGGDNYVGCAYGEDDARLMAAAPELLEALKGMFQLTETLANLCDSIDILQHGGYDAALKARAAIARAEGAQ